MACLPAVATLLLTAVLPMAPTRAADDDPAFVGWSVVLPPLVQQHDPSSADACVSGRLECVRATVRTMQRRFDPLAARCAHSAVFALAYLRTTETYLDTALTPGFYQDVRFVNHEDVAFAEMYFTAYDAFTAGQLSRVPPAWRTAFRAGTTSQVSGSGDLLLGMNAHVQRDLPFVLATIGLVAPDGSSRKPDHDRINSMLNRVVQPLVAEAAARFDPGIETLRTPYGVGYTGLMQMLVAWREAAWRSAERLVTAPDAAARARVAASIEADAEAQAQAIVTATSYVPPVTTTGSRDAYCAANAGTGG
jgi:hypothetical protein